MSSLGWAEDRVDRRGKAKRKDVQQEQIQYPYPTLDPDRYAHGDQQSKDIQADGDAQRASDAASDAPFEAVMSGDTFDLDTRQAAAHARRYAEVGATWWIEEGLGYTLAELRQRIRNGPPRA
jgi:hypothetical protein